MKKPTRYYEIICPSGVIGVCSDEHPEEIMGCVSADLMRCFGRISKEDFERFKSHPWGARISKELYRPALVMEPL